MPIFFRMNKMDVFYVFSITKNRSFIRIVLPHGKDRRVDLPLPVLPTTAKVSPFLILNEMSFNACTRVFIGERNPIKIDIT